MELVGVKIPDPVLSEGSPDEVEDEEPVLAAAKDTRDMIDVYWEILDNLNSNTDDIAEVFQTDTKSVFSLS